MPAITDQEVFDYHATGRPGKIEVIATKRLDTQRDLSLAYTPGVARVVEEIERRPDAAFAYTARGNLVAVISNGTAILGLGNRGPLAGKPVMEGKAVLFKRFADVDVFDLEIDAPTVAEVVAAVKAVAPTFGGINLEDIRAPECFAVEEELKRALDIPVFHDDQHGTAIISGAALLNGLDLAGKRIGAVKVVISGAGAAALASAAFYLAMGLDPERLRIVDTAGVVYRGRGTNMNPYKERFAAETDERTLADALRGADVFLGLSAAGLLTPALLAAMAERPIVFACANPEPEIGYDEARAARPDALVGTGRSDCPNQINNVLGFPFIFRGALDVRARAITEGMKLAAARALAALAREPVPECVLEAYGIERLSFGPDYLIPKPLDPRVLSWEAPAVARAAMAEGVARLPVDLAAYPRDLAARRRHCPKACDLGRSTTAG
jgi:malate dehydrogenase (oxaloacetate-decarboxylating)(NADP+)